MKCASCDSTDIKLKFNSCGQGFYICDSCGESHTEDTVEQGHISKQVCGVCNKTGLYDHENDENGEMTLLSHYFDYVHWGCFDKAMAIRDNTLDKWLYPEDLDNEDLVVNIYFEESEGKYYANFFPLPEDWRRKVTKNKGADGKQSIHDLMEGAI